MSFSAVELIIKKRERFELTTEEIRWLVANYTSGVVADEQMSAMAMAAPATIATVQPGDSRAPSRPGAVRSSVAARAAM